MKKIIPFLVLFILFGFSISARASSSTPPTIKGRAAITVDYETSEIIYAYNIDNKMYPASLTKLMTALLFVDNYTPSDSLTYTQEAKNQESFTFDKDIKPTNVNTIFSSQDALNIMLIVSANDMATMIADNISGSTASFSKLMNERASKLNMQNTHFVTANGLPDSQHYTTAYDLSLLGKAAYLDSRISSVLSTKNYEINENNKTYKLTNTNKLLGMSGCIAGKTGYTEEAGRCLFSVFERNGRKIISVVLDSPNDYKGDSACQDTLSIVDWSYQALASSYNKKGNVVYTSQLEYKPFKYFGSSIKLNIPFIIKEDALYYSNYVNDKEIYSTVKLNKLDSLKLNTSISQGSYTLYERGNMKSYNIYPTIDANYINSLNQTIYNKMGLIAFVLYLANIFFVLFVALIIKFIRSCIIKQGILN